MINSSGSPPGSRPGVMGRRTAIGGIIAAVAAPAVLTRASAQSLGPGPGFAASRAPIPRQQHTITLLADGRALVVGGFYLGPLSSVQYFDPNSQSWHEAAPLNVARYQHAAASMADGSVLVAGGLAQGVLSDVELYDPQADRWIPADPLTIPRFQHAATAMGDGSVVVACGFYQGPLSSVEIYQNGVWRAL